MHDGQISAATANSLVQGYCDDFVALAAVLAQTLEQTSMRSVDLRPSHPSLLRIEQGMRDLADAIRDLMAKPAPAPAPSPAKERPRTAAGPRPLASARSERGAAPKRGGSLQGTSESMPVLSVFQFLGRMRKTGTLHVHAQNEQFTFTLEQGCIASATTNQEVADERLGDLLVEAEACTREQVDTMIEMMEMTSSSSGELFGQQAIATGIVTAAQVRKAIETQVRTRFSRACKSTTASYEFFEGERATPNQPPGCQPIAIA